MPRGVHEQHLTAEGPAGSATAVLVTGPSGSVTVPTFVDAGGRRLLRFRASEPGDYALRLDEASEPFTTVSISAAAATSPAPFIHRDGRKLVTDDGTPFLWMADTWWYALCDRLDFDEMLDFADLRVAQGYNVVQVMAGLQAEVKSFSPLADLDGVWPWTDGYEELNPQWWDAADIRVAAIIEKGLVPALVGSWSYYMLELGRDKMQQHWDQMIARWSALPVVWCIAGEAGLMAYEDLNNPGRDDVVAFLAAEWAAVAKHVRHADPYQNVRTLHPCPAFGHFSSTDVIGDVSDLDLIWLQTGHADRAAIDSSVGTVIREVNASHGLPVVNSEVCYEGIAAGSYDNLQRFYYWSHLLSGAAGHSYGAQGIWAFRNADDPGPGIAWGETTWQEASLLPGARQLGLATIKLQGLPWADLTPSQQTLSIHASEEARTFPYAAASSDTVVAYFPPSSLLPLGIGISQDLNSVDLLGLDAGEWSFEWWNPRRGVVRETWTATVGADGTHHLEGNGGVGSMPSMEDWVLIGSRV